MAIQDGDHAQDPERATSDPAARPRTPRTWVLLDDRPGNSTQSLGLAQALGWPFETRQLHFGAAVKLHAALRGSTAIGLDRRHSDPIEPPWPDLLIASGGRTAGVSRFIRAHSSGRTRTVHLGRRGGACAAHFDLVVTPRNARLWPHPSRLETLLPLSRINESALTEAAETWLSRFQSAPAPRIALLVGGASALYRFDEPEARTLGTHVAKMASDLGASVFVSTSRRTGEEATRVLAETLPDAALFHRWSDDNRENPFLGFLALADRIVVTGESESMLAEVCATDKPVTIYPLPPAGPPTALRRIGEWLVARSTACRADPGAIPWTVDGLIARSIASGVILPPRKLEALHEDLTRTGRANRFGDPPIDGPGTPLREVSLAADRVRALLD